MQADACVRMLKSGRSHTRSLPESDLGCFLSLGWANIAWGGLEICHPYELVYSVGLRWFTLALWAPASLLQDSSYASRRGDLPRSLERSTCSARALVPSPRECGEWTAEEGEKRRQWKDASLM